ncbi:hypothetical protein MLD38_005511 [Melastoma candidum]|uniref:Uncharacterized protein n=1 Tax=Melastoma candidum TaxID=119954 RepID=A0ACB9RJG4_9MYRT|nr:hypothetical protein MLD38_005511 [Melastoma candidum]
MIFVDGVPFPLSSSPPAREAVVALLDHPYLVSASDAFRESTEVNFSEGGRPRCVYVFQREFATVDPSLVDFAGTDEATTCVGLVIRNRRSGRTSVAHLDSPGVVELGLAQILSGISSGDSCAEFDVHIVGAFEDAPTNLVKENHGTDDPGERDGYSLPLCAKIVECLQRRGENFYIQTLFVLKHNTRMDSEGQTFPIFHGCLVEISTGTLFPACFNGSSRGPDEIVRRIRLTACHDDETWKGKLLDTYDTESDEYRVASCSWSRRQALMASSLQLVSDSQLLIYCSTSPSAEGPNFVPNLRRNFDYLIKHPDWRETFPGRRPRIFKRSDNGNWLRC